MQNNLFIVKNKHPMKLCQEQETIMNCRCRGYERETGVEDSDEGYRGAGSIIRGFIKNGR